MGEEQQEEVASQSVRRKEEEVGEKEKEEEPVMPSVQIKPEPEEMECTVSRAGRAGRAGIGRLVTKGRMEEPQTGRWMRVRWVWKGCGQ